MWDLYLAVSVVREVEKRHLKAYDGVACRSLTNWFRCPIQSRDLIQGNEIKWFKIILLIFTGINLYLQKQTEVMVRAAFKFWFVLSMCAFKSTFLPCLEWLLQAWSQETRAEMLTVLDVLSYVVHFVDLQSFVKIFSMKMTCAALV